MHKYLFTLSLSLLTLIASSQIKQYLLYDKTLSADINRNILVMLDSAKRGKSLLDNAFKPVKGSYTVYRFIAKYIGSSFTGKKKQFNDLLILKTDRYDKIIEAYQYTLEWADATDVDLYQSSSKGIYLKDKMNIIEFKFRREWYYDLNDRQLKDSGVVILK